MNIQISRRDALLGTGALVVSFSLHGSISGALAQGAAKPLAPTEVDSFLAIDKAGNVTVYSGKVDLGTGITTALRQIVAEELDIPTSRIELVQGDTTLTPDQGTTWGSLTIQVGGMQLRQAAAAARQALMTEAAKKLGTEQLTVAEGVVSGAGKKVSYGELIGGKTFAVTLDPKQPVKEKAPKDYKVVGKSQPRIDIPDKITGRFTYMQDFKVPGMLHGRVVRPPAIGAKLESVDDGAVKKIPGIVKVVREGNFLAIVASNEWGAIRGADALKATWSKSETLPDQAKLWDYVRNSKVAKLEEYGKIGDTAAAMAADGIKKINATYDFAIHTHGSIGPSCAIAEFKDGALTSLEMMTFFTVVPRCALALVASVKWPVDSTTISAPVEAQSSFAGSRSANTLKVLPSTVIESSLAEMSLDRLPRMESCLSRWARIAGLVRSLTATNSISGLPRAARKTLRPMRPKPFMPTLTAMSRVSLRVMTVWCCV